MRGSAHVDPRCRLLTLSAQRGVGDAIWSAVVTGGADERLALHHYTAATLATFFRPRRSGMGRSRALLNVRTTSRSTRPRISISWRGASPGSMPARRATASEITSSQAEGFGRASMRLAGVREAPAGGGEDAGADPTSPPLAGAGWRAA